MLSTADSNETLKRNNATTDSIISVRRNNVIYC